MHNYVPGWVKKNKKYRNLWYSSLLATKIIHTRISQSMHRKNTKEMSLFSLCRKLCQAMNKTEKFEKYEVEVERESAEEDQSNNNNNTHFQ